MKVLFDHPSPFLLAHGGMQVQIEQTKAALQAIGLEVDFLRWWEQDQQADLIHYFSVPRAAYLHQAHLRHLPVVTTVLFSETCNRPSWKLGLQGLLVRCILGLPFGDGVKQQLNWQSYRVCRRLLVGLEAERQVLIKAFGVRASNVSVVPLGLPEVYLRSGSAKRNEGHLICTGTITPVKRSCELALLAKRSGVPILFVGKPYHPGDRYWQRFQSLIDGQHVKYHPHTVRSDELIGLLQQARGFVLFSEFENWSLAASEAVACGLPLLLPDRKWARERFGAQVRYFAPRHSERDIVILQQFYRDCPCLYPPNIRLWSWQEIAGQLKAIYESLLRTSQ